MSFNLVFFESLDSVGIIGLPLLTGEQFPCVRLLGTVAGSTFAHDSSKGMVRQVEIV